MGYVPTPGNASALHLYLGSCNTYVVVTGAAISIDPASGFSFAPTDVGCPILLVGGLYGGSPQVSFATFWTTVASYIGTNQATLTAAPPANVTGGQAIIFRKISYEVPGSTLPYVLEGSMALESSLSNRPTLNFTIFSFDGSFVPDVGQAVLLTHDTYGVQFGGSIDQIQVTNYSTIAAVQTVCQCVAWESILAHRLLRNTVAFDPTQTDTIQQYTSSIPPYDSLQYRIFFLSQAPVEMVSVTLNGVPQTFAPYADSSTPASHTAQWYWGAWSTQNLIWEDDNGPLLVPGVDMLVVTYTIKAANVLDYFNMKAGDIAKALIALVENEGFLTSGIVDGPIVIQISFSPDDSIDSALNALTSYISNGTDNYWYYATPLRVLHFETQGAVANPAPWNVSVIDASDGNVLLQLSNTITREKYANAALVERGNVQGSILETDSFSGDDSSQEFNALRPLATEPMITVNGMQKTVGLLNDPVSGTGKDWYWSLGSTTVTQDVGGTVLSETDTIAIAYYPLVSYVEQAFNFVAIAARQRVEGGSGQYDLHYSITGGVPQIESVTGVAQQLADYHARMCERVELQSYRGGLAPGQRITVNLPQIKALGTYVVEAVSLSTQNRLALWKFALITGAIIGDWKTAIRNISGGVATGGIGMIAQSGIPSTVSPTSGGWQDYAGADIITVDLAAGINHSILLDRASTAIEAPIYTGGILTAGSKLNIRLVQDGPGNRIVVWNVVFLNLSQPTADANTWSKFPLIYNGTKWEQANVPLYGVPIT